MPSAPVMDGYSVSVNDSVFDVLYGPGRVVDLLSTGGSFRVQFASRGAPSVYTAGGFAVRFPNRTLYWKNPVFVAPFKDDAGWSKVAPIVSAVIAAFRSVGQP